MSHDLTYDLLKSERITQEGADEARKRQLEGRTRWATDLPIPRTLMQRVRLACLARPA